MACSRCGLELSVCACPEQTVSLMGMLRDFRDATDATDVSADAPQSTPIPSPPLAPSPPGSPNGWAAAPSQPQSSQKGWATALSQLQSSPPGSPNGWSAPSQPQPAPPGSRAPSAWAADPPQSWPGPPQPGQRPPPELPGGPPTGSGPTFGAPFPVPSFGPSDPGRSSRRRIVALVAAVAIVVAAVVVSVSVFGSKGTQPGSNQNHAAAPPGSTVPPSGTITDEALALQLAVRPPDISPRWVSVRAESFPSTILNVPLTCLPEAPAGQRSAGAIHEYSLDLQPSGLESGHLISMVYLQATSRDASITRDRLQAPGYDTCGQGEAIAQLTGSGGSDPHITAVTRLPNPVGLSGISERLTISFTFAGTPKTEYVDRFDLIQGRVETRMTAQQCCTPFDLGIETSLLQTISTRIQASSYGRQG